jgi:hypothetical protein
MKGNANSVWKYPQTPTENNINWKWAQHTLKIWYSFVHEFNKFEMPILGRYYFRSERYSSENMLPSVSLYSTKGENEQIHIK